LAVGKDATTATDRDWFVATTLSLRDRVIHRWLQVDRENLAQGRKHIYYMSLEFLIGRLLNDVAGNLRMTDVVHRALDDLGVNFDRVRASLAKYGIAFEESMSDEDLRGLLATFYAKRTLTHQPIDPTDCAEAIMFLASPRARCTSGHMIPVDGGLPEAFLR